MTTKQQQCLLMYLGYDPGPVDGLDGPKTQAALERFRADYGVGAEGLVGAVAKTLAKLEKPEPSTEPAQKIKPQASTFWDSIKWFTEDEFKCKCGGRYCNGYPARMQEAVVRIADAARKHFGRPAHVVSGLRCQKWNAHEGGVANSQHMYGEAIDLRIEGVDSETLRQFVSQQPNHRYSYCINSTNVHFDIPKVGR